MSYYPGWLDAATWIGVVAGVLCGFTMSSFEPGRKRGILKLCACSLVAIGIAFGGTSNLLFNARAPHIATQGRFSHVVIHTGKGSSTSFNLTGPGATSDRLSLSGAKSAVVAGVAAEVTYQAGSGSVLDLRIVDGPHAGLEYTGSDGSGGGVFALLAALVLGMYGVINFLTDGTGTPPVRDDRPSPPGDADTESMLKL